jgi:hypothetical protein
MDTKDPNENTQLSKRKFWRGYEPIEKMTFVMALFAVLYSLITLGLYYISSQALQETQSTNRPYIFTVPKFGFAQMPTVDNLRELPVTVYAWNVGVSPALKTVLSEPIVGLNTDASIVEHMRGCSVTYPEAEGAPIPPSQSFSNASGITSLTVTRTLSDDERKDVAINKTKLLVIFGGVKYSSVRGGAYETIYCYTWNPDSLARNIFPWMNCGCNKMK